MFEGLKSVAAVMVFPITLIDAERDHALQDMHGVRTGIGASNG